MPYLKSLQVYFYLVLIAFVSGYVSIWASFHYQFHDGLVNWYFPHGVRLVALFLLPLRHWLCFLCFTIIGSDTFYHLHYPNEDGLSFNTIKIFLLYFFSEALVGSVIYFFYKKHVKDWFSVNGILWIISLSVLYRFIYLALPAYLNIGFFKFIPPDRYIEFFVAIQLSGYLVGFYFLSFAFIYKWIMSYKEQISKGKVQSFIIVIGLLFLLFILVFNVHPSLEYLLRILLIIPLVLVALKYGGLGVLITTNVTITVLLFFLFDAKPDRLLQYQPFLISYLLIGFLLSIVMFENDKANKKSKLAQENLIEQNKHLNNLSQKLKDLSKKVINIQEKERKFLSQELHDEIGQNIIAIKSAIYLLEISKNQTENLSLIKENVNMMYLSVYELINWLRPNVLDQIGLKETIMGHYFQDKLALSDMNYQALVDVSVVIPEHVENAIFRICQEAVNNVLKHSNATLLKISLIQEYDNLRLKIQDNGGNVEVENLSVNKYQSGNFGLEIIMDRVMALDGVCIINDDNGFVIDVTIPLVENL